jgi:hypothetical protein
MRAAISATPPEIAPRPHHLRSAASCSTHAFLRFLVHRFVARTARTELLSVAWRPGGPFLGFIRPHRALSAAMFTAPPVFHRNQGPQPTFPPRSRGRELTPPPRRRRAPQQFRRPVDSLQPFARLKPSARYTIRSTGAREHPNPPSLTPPPIPHDNRTRCPRAKLLSAI